MKATHFSVLGRKAFKICQPGTLLRFNVPQPLLLGFKAHLVWGGHQLEQLLQLITEPSEIKRKLEEIEDVPAKNNWSEKMTACWYILQLWGIKREQQPSVLLKFHIFKIVKDSYLFISGDINSLENIRLFDGETKLKIIVHFLLCCGTANYMSP